MADPITIEAAQRMGETGGEPTEAERLLFEAWMRGHCWKVSGRWNGTTYVNAKESSSFVDGDTMFTRSLWAAWRDRAALESPAADSQRRLIDNLAAMARQHAWKIRKDDPVRYEQIVDFLRRNDLIGSPLRNDEEAAHG